MNRTTRSQGDHGVAIMITALLLVPMMMFAAFGVDLASWYSRTSYLQKSVDAASLAGTVWMPSMPLAVPAACRSLDQNGIRGGDCVATTGAGPFEVDIERGSGPTRLRVTVTDPNATRFFSQVFGGGNQRLTRSAEAEYNLPIPLGSPLNYFGGDATRTVPANPRDVLTLNWPANAQQQPPVARPRTPRSATRRTRTSTATWATCCAETTGRWTVVQPTATAVRSAARNGASTASCSHRPVGRHPNVAASGLHAARARPTRRATCSRRRRRRAGGRMQLPTKAVTGT